MRWKNTPEDEATIQAMGKALALVFIPAGIFIVGLIYLASPRHLPTSQAWANGTYVNACCSPLILHDGILKTGEKATRYVVSESKFGSQIEVAAGIGVRGRQIELGSNSVFVYFNNDSTALPAIDRAESIHLVGLDDGIDYVFEKRE